PPVRCGGRRGLGSGVGVGVGRCLVTAPEVTTQQLLDVAREALERYHDVNVDDDHALTFRHGDVPCALQGMQLAEGLAVLSLTCVVAWDLPESPNLASSAAGRWGQ